MDQDLRALLGTSVDSNQRARRGESEAVQTRGITSKGQQTMTPAIAVPALENLILNITQEIHVRASLEVTFAAVLEQLGPGFDTPDGKPMPMKIEAFPGGRWLRDLGDGNGHLWGHVQA